MAAIASKFRISGPRKSLRDGFVAVHAQLAIGDHVDVHEAIETVIEPLSRRRSAVSVRTPPARRRSSRKALTEAQLGERFDEVRERARHESLARKLKFGVTDVNGRQTAYGYDGGASRPRFERWPSRATAMVTIGPSTANRMAA